jgi:hypothetical protein
MVHPERRRRPEVWTMVQRTQPCAARGAREGAISPTQGATRYMGPNRTWGSVLRPQDCSGPPDAAEEGPLRAPSTVVLGELPVQWGYRGEPLITSGVKL